MSRNLAVVAAGLVLSGCASWVPSGFDFGFSPQVTAELRIESEPPGADARTSTGANCRTPCLLSVPASRDFSVTLTANGFQPLTVPVSVVAPAAGPLDEFSASASVLLNPNPLFVQLEPVPPPVAKRKPAKGSPQRAPPRPPKAG
jgi:hypothetical protein